LEQFAQPGVKAGGGSARYRIIGGDGASLFHNLPRRVQTDDSIESRAGEPLPCLSHFFFE
jgi:hypothetical protein